MGPRAARRGGAAQSRAARNRRPRAGRALLDPDSHPRPERRREDRRGPRPLRRDRKPVAPPADQPSTPAPVDTPPETPSESGGNGRRTAGSIVGGAGVVALGVGSVFGVMALSKRSDSNADCQPGCTQQGVNLNNQAITDAWVSDFGIGLGVIGVVAGAYLLWTSGGEAKAQATTSGVHLLPRAMSHGAGAALSVDWQ